MGVDVHHSSHSSHGAGTGHTVTNVEEELGGGSGAVVTALAAISAGMFAAAVLFVFASQFLLRLRRRRKQNAKSIADAKGQPASTDIEAGVKDVPPGSASIAVVQIEGMTCTACSGAVERALTVVDGVESAEVNLVNHSARVRFVAPADSEVICAAVEDIGFGASLQSCETAAQDSQQTKVATLSIEGMFCTNCSSAVERALQNVSGVEHAEVNLLSHSATVSFRPPADESSLCATVDDIGFPATLGSVVAKQEEQPQLRRVSSVEKFKRSLGNEGGNACMVRLAFPTASDLKSAQEQLANRSGVAGVVVKPRARELRVSYWSREVGARTLLEELKEKGAKWAGDSRQSDDGHLSRAERALIIRYLISVPPTATIFTIAFIIPNVFPERMGGLNKSVCCGGAVSWQTLLLIIFATPVQFGVGAPMHRSAFRALRSGHLSMDVLVSMGTMLAYFYSLAVTLVWAIVGSELPSALKASEHSGHDGHGGSVAPPPHFFEASAMLLSILMLGKCIESHAKRKTGDCLRELASRWPSEARLVSSDSKVPCDLLQISDKVAVTMGETLPCDGIIVQGEIHVDESVLTGEDTPVRKVIGDFVVGGSKCAEGAAQFEATAVGANTAMSQVQAMVEAAQAAKPDIARVANKVAGIFVPVILGLSLLTFSIWAVLVASGAVDVPSSLSDPDGEQQSEARLAERSFFISRFALALMMMACPCAFGLAAPTAILVATGVAARRGCLIKSGRALESAEHLKAVVLDKTGTVTVGKPTVTRVALAPAKHPVLARLPPGLNLKEDAEQHVTGAVNEWLPGDARGILVPLTCGCIDTALLSGDPAGDTSDVEVLGTPGGAPPTLDQTVALWAAVGAVEAPSQHPLGKALAAHAQGLLNSVPEAEDWKTVTGLGVEGRVPGLGWVRVGRLTWACTGKAPRKKCNCPETCRCTAADTCGCECWMEPEEVEDKEDSALLGKTKSCRCKDSCQCTEMQGCGCSCWKMRQELGSPVAQQSPDLVEDWIASMGAQGAGVVAVAIDDQLLGAVVMRDVLQPGAPAAVKALKDRGIQVWLCSGDQKTTTRAVAAELGITHWVGEAMPQDKSRLVGELAAQAPVGFVGDGVNDAIALGAATLGVAIGAGAHVTVDAADVVLVRSAFEDFIGFVELSRRALRTIRMNYVWAFGFNILGLPLAAGVLYPHVHFPPVVAGSAMAGSSLIVVFNSLRLRSAGKVWGKRAKANGPVPEVKTGLAAQTDEVKSKVEPEPEDKSKVELEPEDKTEYASI